MNELFNKIGLPEAAFLGQKVFKKLFLENASLSSKDKKFFRDDIEAVTWQYTLKPNTIHVKAYQDATCEYIEIVILEVTLRSQCNSYKRIAEIIHRSIPYPLLLVFFYENICALSLAPKRFNQAEKGAIVADDFHTTGWINLLQPTEIEEAFLNSLKIVNLPHTHFLAFYTALVDRFVALDCALLSGQYRLEFKSQNQKARQETLSDCHKLKEQIAQLTGSLYKETQFNRKVEMNIKIKQLEQKLREQSESL